MEKIFYRVKNNQNLLEIANCFNVSVFDLILDNNLVREVEVGDVLIINKTDGLTYTVKPSDTIESIAEKFCTTKEQLLLKNRPLPYVFYGIKIKI
jgi:LysM repeat protein